MKSRLYVAIAAFASLAFGSQAAWAQQNRVMDIVDQASSPIYHLYISDARSKKWGPDQLGAYEIIRPGHYRTNTIAGERGTPGEQRRGAHDYG